MASGEPSLVRPRTMPGVMELLPRDQVAFQRMLDTIRAGFERFGFLPIETPVMEHVDVLLNKSGGETEKQVYFAQSTGARAQGKEPELALRFDLTVPLARYVAEHEGQLQFPLRRYQIQRVYRGESAQRGRYREFYQCDIDVIARDELSLQFDAEMPVVIATVLEELGLDFTVQLNHRKLMAGFLRMIGVEVPGAAAAVLREVDKLDKKPREAVAASLAGEAVGLSGAQVDELLAFLETGGSTDEILALLEQRAAAEGAPAEGIALFRQGLEELQAVVRMMRQLGLDDRRFRVDLRICRGLDYYTGMVYETTLDEHPELGSVCSGGRYDDLAALYTKSHLPGVGLSIGATRLFYQLQQLGKAPEQTTVQILVANMDDGSDDAVGAAGRRLAAELREAGLCTELYHKPVKLAKQMKAANRGLVPFVLILGADEMEAGTVVLKDMSSGEQSAVPRADLVEAVRRAIARSGEPGSGSVKD